MHNDHIKSIKRFNRNRVCKLLRKKGIRSLFEAWKQVTKNDKIFRHSNAAAIENLKHLQKRLYIKIWSKRITATKDARRHV